MKPTTTLFSALTLLAAAPFGSAQTSSWQVDGGTKLVFADANGAQVSLTRPGQPNFVPNQPSSSLALLSQGWNPLGPFGGDADDVAASPTSPNIVLAGFAPATSNGTLYRSTDGGVNWSEVAALSGLDVNELEFASNGTAYAGTVDSVWRSTDDGVTWTKLGLGIGANDQVFEVTLDPSSASTLWVGVADALGAQTSNLLRSTDSGVTWSNLTPAGAAGTAGRGVALDPADPNKVFAVFGGAFGGGSAWRSNDAGATWTNISAALPNAPMNDVTLTNGVLRVCGGLLFGSQFFGLFESIDDGTTWTALHDATWPSTVINDIEIQAVNPGQIFLATAGAGIFRSLDGGATWSFGIGGTAGLSVNEVAASPTGGAPIYSASSSNAIWRSTDGTNFIPSSGGIGALNVEGIAVNPLDPSNLVAAFQGLNDGGVFVTTDGGINWTLEPLPGVRFNDAGFSPTGQLFAISDGPTTIAAEGLWRRDSGGWIAIGPNQGPAFESEFFAFDFGVDDPNHIIIGGSDFGVAGSEITLWTSTNGGATWSKDLEGPTNMDVRDVRFLKDGTNSTAVASFSNQNAPAAISGVLRTITGGATWAQSSTGLNTTTQAYGLSLSPANPQTIYLADRDFNSGGIFKSTDGGVNWTAAGFAGRLSEIAVDPLHPGKLYTGGLLNPKAQSSIDDGVTQTDFTAGLPSNFSVRDIDIIEGQCTTLLLATSVGVYGQIPSCNLEADIFDLSLSAGGSQAFTISAGPKHAGNLYWLVSSASGTSPGIVLDGQLLPLNVDSQTITSMNLANSPVYPGSLGVLNADGQATTAVVLPPGAVPGLAGVTVHHAAVVVSLTGVVQVVLATNAEPLTLNP